MNTPALKQEVAAGRDRGSPIVPRLAAVEGLRGYLAFWVLICHVLWASGYEADGVSLVPKLLLNGKYAVETFMLISGFVIFLLLDKRQETYRQFVVRRFFRLFPLFIVLFLIAIAAWRLMLWNTGHAGQYLTRVQIDNRSDQFLSWSSNLPWHVLLHAAMLHGAVPPVVLEHSSFAFLSPAWSLSLEWQFYLLAPLAYALVVSSKPLRRIGLCAGCVLVFVSARIISHTVPAFHPSAAVPSFLPFFFLGAASYFLYKRHSEEPLFDSVFPVFFSIAVFLFVLGGESRLQLAPVVLWIAFLGLLLEERSSACSRLLSPLFTNPLVQYLGRISYSLYLSHLLLIAVLQGVLLKWVPQLSLVTHVWVLLGLTTPISVGVSALLYRFVEAPGIRLGRSLSLGVSERATWREERSARWRAAFHRS